MNINRDIFIDNIIDNNNGCINIDEINGEEIIKTDTVGLSTSHNTSNETQDNIIKKLKLSGKKW